MRLESSRHVSWRLAQFAAVVAILVAMLLAAPARGFAQTYKVDSGTSTELTDYLRKHRLPLVGAQVLKDADGDSKLVLYGFVASDYGKSDAVRRALAFLHATDIPVENRIVIRPEIANMQPGQDAGAGSSPTSNNQTLDQVLNDIDHYGVKFPMMEQNSP